MNNRLRLILGPLAISLIFVSAILMVSQAARANALGCVPGPHSGTIAANETWCLSESPHIISSDVGVDSGVTLTIEAGVKVLAAPSGWGPDTGLLVSGHLEALGTEDQPIIFTSQSDATKGGWEGVVFYNGSSGHLRNVIIRYGGDSNGSAPGEFYVGNGLTAEPVIIEDSQIINSSQFGFYVENGQLQMSNTLIDGVNTYAGYIAGADSRVTFNNVTITNNAINRILLEPGAMTGADFSLPPINGSQGYELDADFPIPAGITMTVEPGVKVIGGPSGTWGPDTGLLVSGHLEANGTASQPIIFTSLGDSGPGQWEGIFFYGGTGNLSYTTVRCAGDPNGSDEGVIFARDVITGEVHIENSTIETCSGDGMHLENSNATLSNVIVQGCNYRGINVLGGSAVQITSSDISNNGTGGLWVQGDEALVKVTHSTISGNGSAYGGVRNDGKATVVLSGEPDGGNIIENNAGYGAQQVSVEGVIPATYNWWGDASGPTHASNPGGVGEEVSDRVIFSEWLTETTGIPVAQNRYVQVYSPNRASPGEPISIGMRFYNPTINILSDVVMILELPKEAAYLYSTGGGIYLPERHEVVWRLGDRTSLSSFNALARIQYNWGLAGHTKTDLRGKVAASNLDNPAVDLAYYLGYEGLPVAAEHTLSQAEIDAELAADPELNNLLQQAQAQGFVFYGVAHSTTFDDGTTALDLITLNRDQWREALIVHRVGDLLTLIHSSDVQVSEYNAQGGWRNNWMTGDWDFWGTMNGAGSSQGVGFDKSPAVCNDMTYGECYKNCLMATSPTWISGVQGVGGLFGVGQHEWESAACKACYTEAGQADCIQCGKDIIKARNAAQNNFSYCSKVCNLMDDRQEVWCNGDLIHCYQAGWYTYSLTWTCNLEECTYTADKPVKDVCMEKTVCVEGKGCCIRDTTESPYPDKQACADPEKCPLCLAGACQSKKIEIIVAGDPNDKHGPAEVTPGETVTYTINYENVGEGIAYGVYVEDTLPEELQGSKMLIVNSGHYLPSSNTILWNVGELAPGGKGSVSFQVAIPTDVVSGTMIANQAVVYFPSVPEVTPTNDVVSLVQDVTAHAQFVEAVEGVVTPISLSGYTPTGNPLTYEVIQQPRNGALSGIPPDLTYTPSANFEGMDGFLFQVSDGALTSRPAEVIIAVQTGTESVAPEVVAVSPWRDEQDLQVQATPVYTDTYAPFVWAWFSEPIDASTVNTNTFYIKGADGQHLAGVVHYDSNTYAATFAPGVPLEKMEVYTATLASSVKDTSGNPLAAPVVWSFSTESEKLYLPMITKSGSTEQGLSQPGTAEQGTGSPVPLWRLIYLKLRSLTLSVTQPY
jgi:uncharacterized repeat protein (TIGR01451 family)